MKNLVTDTAVTEYVRRLRQGVPLGKLFPAAMSDCDFTEPQREIIQRARRERKTLLKRLKAQSSTTALTEIIPATPLLKTTTAAPTPKTRPQSKLSKMLFLQSGLCFFCGQLLKVEDASIEHLNPRARGGTSTEDNEVVCHTSLNATFGDLDLKRKFAFVLKEAGKFSCPKK